MTPTQLKAFACVVRLGSVKAAADELAVSEAAVSMHVGQLRRELDDRLFTRTASGLAFTPGGLRLASRAVEILGLQDRTVREVSQAGNGRRLLRVAASAMFAEHAAPGLIELFAAAPTTSTSSSACGRPASSRRCWPAARWTSRSARPRSRLPDALTSKPFLNYDVLAVVAARSSAGRPHRRRAQAREQTWMLGPVRGR